MSRQQKTCAHLKKFSHDNTLSRIESEGLKTRYTIFDYLNGCMNRI